MPPPVSEAVPEPIQVSIPPEPVKEVVVVKSRPAPSEPVPAYLQGWFESRGIHSSTIRDALGGMLALPSEEWKEIAKQAPETCNAFNKVLRTLMGQLKSEDQTNEVHALQSKIILLQAELLIVTLRNCGPKSNEQWREFNRAWEL